MSDTILVNDRRITLAELAAMDPASITSVDARGCTALTAIDAPEAEIDRNPDYVSGGVDARGYYFEALKCDGEWRVLAGCRNYTLTEAREHWGPGGASDRPDCLALVEKLASEIAKLQAVE